MHTDTWYNCHDLYHLSVCIYQMVHVDGTRHDLMVDGTSHDLNRLSVCIYHLSVCIYQIDCVSICVHLPNLFI